jgi:hypothetical protein
MLLTGMTITFLREFGVGLWLTCPLWMSLALAITLLGQIAGKNGGWTALDSFYWSFVTATTVGLRRSASGEPDIAHSRHPHRHAGSDLHRHHHRSGRACGYLRAGRP